MAADGAPKKLSEIDLDIKTRTNARLEALGDWVLVKLISSEHTLLTSGLYAPSSAGECEWHIVVGAGPDSGFAVGDLVVAMHLRDVVNVINAGGKGVHTHQTYMGASAGMTWDGEKILAVKPANIVCRIVPAVSSEADA